VVDGVGEHVFEEPLELRPVGRDRVGEPVGLDPERRRPVFRRRRPPRVLDGVAEGDGGGVVYRRVLPREPQRVVDDVFHPDERRPDGV